MGPKYTCPCCGYMTLEEPPPGTFDICPVCWWEDDAAQFEDPEFAGGANLPSLRQAQANFRQFGASEECFKVLVRRPEADEVKDATWRPL